MSEPLVVHADNHGRPELIYAIDRFYDGNTRQLIAGDVLDGPDTRGSLQAICDVGALMLLGNHEWCFLASVLEDDRSVRLQFAGAIWPRIHDRVLQSYGVYPSVPTPHNAERLYQKMPESHRSLLGNAQLFYESDQYLVIHGGVTAKPWEVQRRDLTLRNELRRSQNQYLLDGDFMPDQLHEALKLADRNVTVSGLGKLLVNGHFHRPFTNLSSRFSDDKKRLYLATSKNDRFALVWETWSKNLVKVES